MTTPNARSCSAFAGIKRCCVRSAAYSQRASHVRHRTEDNGERLVCTGRDTLAEISRFMTANHALYPTGMMARVLGVSQSGLYAWRDRKPSRRAQADAVLTEKTAAFHGRSELTYGSPRINAGLLDESIQAGRKRVERLMKAAGLRGARKRKCGTTGIRDKRHRPAADMADRNFYADAPNVLWGEPTRAIGSNASANDITFVPTWAGFIYLPVVLYTFSRRIAGSATG